MATNLWGSLYFTLDLEKGILKERIPLKHLLIRRINLEKPTWSPTLTMRRPRSICRKRSMPVFTWC